MVPTVVFSVFKLLFATSFSHFPAVMRRCGAMLLKDDAALGLGCCSAIWSFAWSGRALVAVVSGTRETHNLKTCVF